MGLYTRNGVVKAYRWEKNGDHPEDNCSEVTGRPPHQKDFLTEGKVVRRYRHPDVPGARVCPHCRKPMYEHGWIDSGEEGHVVCPGDWIIGADGEYLPVKPALFYGIFNELTEGGG